VPIGDGANAVGDAVAPCHGNHTVTIEPWVISRAGDADDRGALVRKELDCDRPDPARSGGDHDNITRPRLDRARRGPGRRTHDEQGACDLPRHSRWARRQLGGIHRDELGLAGAVVGESDHLVAYRDAANVRTEFVDDAREVASLT
jgi:hypothetical protein